MSKSLAEQLLKAGLGDAKKLKNIKKEQHKARVQAGKNGTVVNEASQLAEQTRQQQIERDRDLNQRKKAEAEQKALQAQVKQLIEMNLISDKGDVGFNFTDQNKVKKIYVSSKVQQQLINGQIAIAKNGEAYQLVPVQVAERIAQRVPAAVVLLNQKDETLDEEDPYADFQIPDDLMW